jgi:hypothetical protein
MPKGGFPRRGARPAGPPRATWRADAGAAPATGAARGRRARGAPRWDWGIW